MSGISGIGGGARPLSGGVPAVGGDPAAADEVRSPDLSFLTGVVAGTEGAIARGARGDAVRQVQAALLSLHYEVRGGADGVFGRGTEEVLAKFQREVGIAATGRIDRETVLWIDKYIAPAGAALKSADLAPLLGIVEGDPPLTRGARGDAVRALQRGLIITGHALPNAADGAFGPGTEGSLKSFQREAGLPQTGQLDKTTLLALDGRLAGTGSAPRPTPPVVRPTPAPAPAPAPTGPRSGEDTPEKLKETRDLVRYMLGQDSGGDIGGKTLGEVLAAAEGDRVVGLLDDAMIARIPHLSDANKTLLKNSVRAAGPIPYVDRGVRAMLAKAPDAASRRSIISMDREPVAGEFAAGSGSVHPQEVLEWRRTSGSKAPWVDEVLSLAIHEPWKRASGAAVRPTTCPSIPARPITNDGGNISFAPRAALRPTNIGELADAMRWAGEAGRHLKPIGSLHSFSRVHQADDVVLMPEGLSFVEGPQTLAASGEFKRGEVDPVQDKLVRVGSGTQIRNLNRALWETHGLALPNMGGYDEQTLAGVVNTATHGSGLQFGPFNDIVKSMDMVLPGGKKVRIEKTEGITDPVEFRAKHPDMELIQDDAIFNSSVVSMGSMGVVHSYVIGTRNKYYLNEKRTETTWENAKGFLEDDGVYGLMASPDRPEVPGQRFPARHFEILINPHETNGTHTASITTRKDAAEPRTGGGFEANNRNAVYRMFNEAYGRPWFGEAVLSVAPDLVGGVTRDVITAHPGLAPALIDGSVKSLTDDVYIERSYNVFNIGAANEVPAISSEIAVPIRGDNFQKAMDALLARTKRFEAEGKYHTGPISIRFVKGTQATLAPQNGQDVAMFEIIFTKDTPHATELLRAYEEVLRPFGGRPHFGQVNFTNPQTARAMYGAKLDEWNSVRRALDPTGTMRNRFTDEALGAGGPR